MGVAGLPVLKKHQMGYQVDMASVYETPENGQQDFGNVQIVLLSRLRVPD
jgi:hypothetical protein